MPKPALFSIRTSSLKPEADATSSGAVLSLALSLLHEMRLAEDSPFWGYLQSLPRHVTLPPLWAVGNDDEQKALLWLKGTEAERYMAKQENDGLSLSSLETFFTEHPLLPTSTHPSAPTFHDFLHAFALVSTRAFIIDMYHLIAMVPFADLLNHAGVANTSLASDDFVCHVCGELAECAHDMPYPGRPPERLAHLDVLTRANLSESNDTVDMYVELEVDEGEEVMNSYGEVGDARLLVEWGFVLMDHGEGVAVTFGGGDDADDEVVEVEDDEDFLLFNCDVPSVNHLGQVSTALFRGKADELEAAWRRILAEEDVDISPELRHHVERVCGVLKTRLNGMYRPELGVDELYDLTLELGDGDACQTMAMNVAMDERALLVGVLERWEALLE